MSPVELGVLFVTVAVIAIGIGIDIGYTMAQEEWSDNADESTPIEFKGQWYKVRHYAKEGEGRFLQQEKAP